jgi:Domain of unknown function (DUF5615)
MALAAPPRSPPAGRMDCRAPATTLLSVADVIETIRQNDRSVERAATYLDEHYSPEIARQLRTRGQDVMAVAERPDLVGLGDDELLARMAQEQRAIMTNNVKDFMPLAAMPSADSSRRLTA